MSADRGTRFEQYFVEQNFNLTLGFRVANSLLLKKIVIEVYLYTLTYSIVNKQFN